MAWETLGAVLFVRLWRNGNVDSDCAITERAADGSWEEPSGSGGSGWIDDPLVRSETGWDGDPVAWLGSSGIGLGDADPDADDDVEPGPHPDIPYGGMSLTDVVAAAADEAPALESRWLEEPPWAGLDVRALLGAASKQVAAIEVTHGGRTWRVPVDSPSGAFIIGIEGRGPATLRVLDRHGRPLADADGATERTA